MLENNDTFNTGLDFFGSLPEKESDNNTFSVSKNLYFKLTRLFYEKSLGMQKSETIDCNEIKKVVEDITKQLHNEEKMLMGLANAPYSYIRRHISPTLNSYVITHSINVMLYSLKISIELGVPDARLLYIAITALFHNLGLLDAPELLYEKLDNGTNEAKDILNYEQNTTEYLKNVTISNFNINAALSLVTLIHQDKDTIDPKILKEAVYQYSMIIHICDIFEQLTHQKTYGERLTPVNAMKKMRDEMNDYFHHDIIKLFFNKLSIYPLGSFVELSSREVAKIVELNNNFIMRPTVLKIVDSNGEIYNIPEKINLRENPNLYIKYAVIDDMLTEKFIDIF